MTGNMAFVVSRRLKRDGYTVSSPDRRHKREGLFVQGDRSGNVTVICDLDSESAITALEVLHTVERWIQVTNVSITIRSVGACFVRFTYTPKDK